MKKTIVLFIFFNSYFLLNAQTDQKSLSFFPSSNSKKEITVAYFMNGELCSSFFIRTVNEKFIDTYNVEKKKITIEGKEYNEQFYFTSKKDYNPKRIKINDVKLKYATDKNASCVYFIDGLPVSIDDSNTDLDESNILEIICHLYNNVSENLKINCIEIYTKTKQNIEKAGAKIIN